MLSHLMVITPWATNKIKYEITVSLRMSNNNDYKKGNFTKQPLSTFHTFFDVYNILYIDPNI